MSTSITVLITVGCDGRPAAAARQVLGGRTLLERSLRGASEVARGRMLVSVPDADWTGPVVAAGAEPLVRPPSPGGGASVETAIEQALAGPAAGARFLLVLDPLLPLRRRGRLTEALVLRDREDADCVFSCHRESALLWRRSAMGLVPYFDPANRPAAGGEADVPWLREDGSVYLLRAAAYRRYGQRHCGRLVPLETAPDEAVVAADPAGLTVCRALLASRESRAATASA